MSNFTALFANSRGLGLSEVTMLFRRVLDVAPFQFSDGVFTYDVDVVRYDFEHACVILLRSVLRLFYTVFIVRNVPCPPLAIELPRHSFCSYMLLLLRTFVTTYFCYYVLLLVVYVLLLKFNYVCAERFPSRTHSSTATPSLLLLICAHPHQ